MTSRVSIFTVNDANPFLISDDKITKEQCHTFCQLLLTTKIIKSHIRIIMILDQNIKPNNKRGSMVQQLKAQTQESNHLAALKLGQLLLVSHHSHPTVK